MEKDGKGIVEATSCLGSDEMCMNRLLVPLLHQANEKSILNSNGLYV